MGRVVSVWFCVDEIHVHHIWAGPFEVFDFLINGPFIRIPRHNGGQAPTPDEHFGVKMALLIPVSDGAGLTHKGGASVCFF